MDAVDNFYTDQSFADWYKTTKDILNIFPKVSVFGLDDYQFWEYRLPQYLVQKSENLWMARSEMTEHSVLVLIQKWHKAKLFWKFQCKRLSFNNPVNSSWAWQVCALLKFQLWWFVDPASESKSKVLLKLSMKLLTLVWNYAVCSQRS